MDTTPTILNIPSIPNIPDSLPYSSKVQKDTTIWDSSGLFTPIYLENYKFSIVQKQILKIALSFPLIDQSILEWNMSRQLPIDLQKKSYNQDLKKLVEKNILLEYHGVLSGKESIFWKLPSTLFRSINTLFFNHTLNVKQFVSFPKDRLSHSDILSLLSLEQFLMIYPTIPGFKNCHFLTKKKHYIEDPICIQADLMMNTKEKIPFFIFSLRKEDSLSLLIEVFRTNTNKNDSILFICESILHIKEIFSQLQQCLSISVLPNVYFTSDLMGEQGFINHLYIPKIKGTTFSITRLKL